MIIYGQRTADGRLAFGGRGAPYHFGSRIAPEFDTDERVRAMLRATLAELFPVTADVELPFPWGGPLAVPRDWHPHVRFDRARGLASAGGYVGDGVAAANLAGRTLADLVLGRDTDLTHLPIVGHRSPRWEPEPLRWVGARVAAAAAAERSPRPPRRRLGPPVPLPDLPLTPGESRFPQAKSCRSARFRVPESAIGPISDSGTRNRAETLENACGNLRPLGAGGQRWRAGSAIVAMWRTVYTDSPDRTPPRANRRPACQFDRPSSGVSRANWPSTQRVKPSPTNGASTAA